ncbi:MAG: SpoIIE family protein phosphatase [Prevotella sp.]|nr:SpoIIE family protein phosphatase [Prevotella sp.]
MRSKRKLRPFYRRLTRRIGIAQFVVMALASYLIYIVAEEALKEEEFDLYEKTLKVTEERVRRILSDVYVGTYNHVPEIEENLNNPDKMYDIMHRVVELNPHIRSCGLSFVADYYPQKGHWFCPYAIKGADGKIVSSNIGSAKQDYLKAEWFTEAIKADTIYWSKPFFDSRDTVTPLVSFIVPIHDKQGKTVAILGADMSLSRFSGRLMKGQILKRDSIHVQVKTDQAAYDDSDDEVTVSSFRELKELGSFNFVIDHDGTYIAHPDSSYAIKNNYFEMAKATTDTIDDYVGHQMVKGEKGAYTDDENDISHFEFFDLNSSNVYLFYRPIEHTSWSVGLVVPRFMIDGFAIFIAVILLILIGLALLIGRLVGKSVIKNAAKPLRQLAESADEVSKGNFMTSLPRIKHNDEIRLLRDSFEQMQHSLRQYIEELKETTASKASIESELKIAHDIQMSMLPKTFPPFPERDDIDIYGTLTPAKDVGGDLFDFFIRDEHLFFCIGDVSGKGVPASLVMAVTRSLFRNISAHVTDPNLIMTALNDVQSESNDTNMFVTLFVGVLDLANGKLQYCNAGHNAPLIILATTQRPVFLNVHPNLPIGVMPKWQFTLQETVLEPQSAIFLFTDGLNEAEDATHAQFGQLRIIREIESLLARSGNQPEVMVRCMTDAVHAFVGEAEQSDDLTMLAIRYQHHH